MEEDEIWKTCAKHPKYMCSNLGRIANIKTGFILKPQINKKRILYYHFKRYL